ncbi:MAG: ABC transporter ATP-binding protein [Ignavibacteria bacterium]
MKSIELSAEKISKSYSGKIIFKNFSITLKSGESVTILGRNGSGKSTLIKLLTGLIASNKGKVNLKVNESTVPQNLWYSHIGLISPYLNLYDELTGIENLEFFCSLRNNSDTDMKEKIDFYLNKVRLFEKRNEPLKNYSSGMKQKLKLIFAIINEPGILYMDEPRSNLDAEGIDIICQTAEDQKKKGILIVATNDTDDIQLCENSINIEDYK